MPDEGGAVPPHIVELAAERDRARAERDWSRADELRDQIRAEGFIVTDTSSGPAFERAPAFEAIAPSSIRSILGDPPALGLSIHLLAEGFPEDLERFLRAFGEHDADADCEVVVVDNAGADGQRVAEIVGEYDFARAVHLDQTLGWAAARNAGLKTSKGAVIALADLSIEPTGPIVGPLLAAFEDPEVAVAGPFGLVTSDMREFEATDGPSAAAIEGYLMAVRREALSGQLIREAFSWYRNADIDLSFQVRAAGGDALVVPLPVAKHEHRGWAGVPEGERSERSRRNHGIFLKRWKDRADLIAR